MHFRNWFGHAHCDDDAAFHFAGRSRFRQFGGGDELGGPFGGRHGGARFGRMFGHGDLKLILLTDSIDEALDFIKDKSITRYGLLKTPKRSPLRWLFERA